MGGVAHRHAAADELSLHRGHNDLLQCRRQLPPGGWQALQRHSERALFQVHSSLQYFV